MSKRKIIYMIITMLLSVGCFTSYGDVKASGESVSESRTDENNEITFDCVWFGRYPQADKTGRIYDPIKWRVLSVAGDDMFLMADNTLDCKVMNQQAEDKEEYELDLRWENCDMRTWLNSDFYKKAFNKTEQNAVIETKVKTKVSKGSSVYSQKKSITTKDKVYLLSKEEIENKNYGIITKRQRAFKNTAYVKNKKAESNFYGNGLWWLRSSGIITNQFDYVDGFGNSTTETCTAKYLTVCPVIHIKKSSAAWIYAGTVCSDGTVNEVNKPASITKAGWIKKNGVYTYLDKKNNPVTKNKGWYKIDDKYYYLDATGNRITKNAGWYKINGKYYYLRKSGVRVTKNKGWHKINGKYYYLKKDGTRVTKNAGWYKIGNKYYYLKKSGKRVKKQEGWYQVGNRYYQIKTDGTRIVWDRSSWQKIGNKYYYIDPNGKRVKKKAQWHINSYVKADGSLCKGWTTINGKRYYFKSNGELAGERIADSFDRDEDLLYFKKDGQEWYQMKGFGAVKKQYPVDFSVAMKKYPNKSVFDGLGNKNADQCNVYVYAVGRMISGKNPETSWKKTYDLEHVKVGDIIKYHTLTGGVHYVMVTDVVDDCIEFTDANGSGNVKNQVAWHRWAFKERYRGNVIYILSRP